MGIELRGIFPESVIKVLESRRKNDYQPGSKSDGNNVVLVVEGGGMRGVISCAMLSALNELAFTDCFDSIIGTSSGAINGSYFINGRASIGTSIYTESISNKEFINPLRWPNPMDLDLLFDVLTKDPQKKFDEVFWDKPQEFFVTTTDTKNGDSIVFDKEKLGSTKRLMKALKASASTPLFTNNVEDIDGHTLNDGLINDGIPLNIALKQNPTHLVCTLTRESNYRKKNSWLIAKFEHLIIKKYPKLYQDKYYSRSVPYNDAMERIYGLKDLSIPCLAISTDELGTKVSNGEVNKAVLQNAAREAMQLVFKTFNADKPARLYEDL